MAANNPLRLEITLNRPNEMFENWLERWLRESEQTNARSQHKLRLALDSLRKYPLPLYSGRECAVLQGFGGTLCKLIDDELSAIKAIKPESILNNNSFQADVQKLLRSVKKKNKVNEIVEKLPKMTKKEQKVIEEEKERRRQITMSQGSFRIILLVDIQETSGKNKRTLDQTRSYLETLGVEYEIRRLTVGDFLWIARDSDGNELVLPYIIERKRMDDLGSSIRDGRFHEQKHRLRQCGIQNIIYLIEDYGDNEHLGLPLPNLQQAMINTHIHSGFTITHTENHWRSMIYLHGMTKTIIDLFKDKLLIGTAKEDLKIQNPKDHIVGLLKFRALYEDSSKNSQLTIRELFVQQLVQLNSLSLEKALAIVANYPTPRVLFDAYDCCASEMEAKCLLANIRSGELQRPIGEKISQIIYDFYKTDFKN